MPESYQSLPRENEYNSKFFDETDLYQDIPVHVRHITVAHSPSRFGYETEHIYVYSSGPHTLYYRGTDFVERETLKDTWNKLRKLPGFSYQVEDTDMTLNELLKKQAHFIDDYTDYIEDSRQEAEAIERNLNTCRVIDRLRLGLAPEKTLYPAFHDELQDTVKAIQEDLKAFFQHHTPPKRHTNLFDRHAQDDDAYNISYHFRAYKKHTEKDLLLCLKKLHEREGDGPSPVGSILPGAKTIPEAMLFLKDFHQSMENIHSILMKNRIDTTHHEMMQADILMMLKQLGEKYPNISLIQEPIQAIQQVDKAYQEDHPAYAAYAKEQEAKTSFYAVEGDLAEKLPQVSIAFKDGTTIQDDLVKLYYNCQYGAYRNRLNDDVVSFTVDQEKHQPRVMDFSSLLGSEVHLPETERTAPLQSTLQDVLAVASKNGRVLLEEHPHLGEVRPTFRYYSSREAAVLDQYQNHQNFFNLDTNETHNPYHEIAIGQKDCATCKTFYVDGQNKGDSHYAPAIDTMIGANILPDLRADLSQNGNEALKQAVFFEQCVYVNDFVQLPVDVSNDSDIRTYSAILDDYVVNEFERYGVELPREAPDDYETDIDLHIAEIAFEKVKKEYPTATQEQCKKFVGNLIQENSPNGFIKGRNYGYSIAEKVQKEQTAKKQKKMTH